MPVKVKGSTSGLIQPSPEQKPIIVHRGGHLQVVACAGSGKTEAMAQRVAHLLIEGAEPRSIVAFTFTERAAASMKARILLRVTEALGSESLDALGPLFVGTIHAYCFRLLHDHVPEYANHDVLDEHRHAGLLSREYRRLELEDVSPGGKWADIADFMRHVDAIENELIPTKALGDSVLGRAYERYLETLDRYHFLTYGQQISAAVHALERPEVFARVHGPLRHLIVDEYQDINPAQERLIQLLSQAPVALCVVGDDDQSIYQWRGSQVENILTFKRRYRADTYPLSTNRRSRPKIIKEANSFSLTIKPRLEKSMKPHREAAGPEVVPWTAEGPEDEAAKIGDSILKLVGQGYHFQDAGILLRSVRTSSPPFVAALQKRRIPFRCAGRTGLFLHPEPQLLGRTYAWLSDNDWKREKYSEGEPISRQDILDGYSELFNLGPTESRALGRRIDTWQKEAHDDQVRASLVGDYDLLLRALAVHRWDLSDPVLVSRMGSLARFSELLADFENVTRRARWVEEVGGRPTYRAGNNHGPWYYKRLFIYIQHYALDAYEAFAGEEEFEFDAVDVMTIHQAKGLEWPVVFVPCLVEQRFPPKSMGKEQDWLLPEPVFPEETRKRYEGGETDERRLFYVAMTRARDILYLSWFERIKNVRKISRFLKDVAGEELPKLAKLPAPPAPEGASLHAILRPTLTFSDLASYETCPFAYRLSSLMGFQPALVAELGYGRAVHHVLRQIAEHVRRNGRVPSKAQIDRILGEDFYLPFAHQEAFDRLSSAAHGLIERYVADYGEELERVWEIERPFELHLGPASVTGRADVILDYEEGLPRAMAIVDYKTAVDDSRDSIYAFQLAIYAAAGQAEGIDVRAAYLHDLHEGRRVTISTDADAILAARSRATELVEAIVEGNFTPRPERGKCSSCDTRFVCRHGRAR
jgi:DNA helicase-2/ATP-dependent DNA helicase PcrA